MIYRIVFYRPDIDHGATDNAISFHTWFWNSVGLVITFQRKMLKILWMLRCSHCEVWRPDEEGNFEADNYQYEDVEYTGFCYTSTMGQAGGKDRPPENGCVKRPASQILIHPERWFWTEVEVYPGEANIWLEYQVANNKGYDKLMIASFFLPWRFGDKQKYICSEFVHGFLKAVGLLRDKKQCPSPLRLAFWLWKTGQKFYDLKTGKELK